MVKRRFEWLNTVYERERETDGPVFFFLVDHYKIGPLLIGLVIPAKLI